MKILDLQRKIMSRPMSERFKPVSAPAEDWDDLRQEVQRRSHSGVTISRPDVKEPHFICMGIPVVVEVAE